MDVVGIGFPCIDLLLNVDEFPQPNSYARLQDYSWQGGGKVATALVALGRLGVETGLLSVMGGDPFAKFLIGDFQRHSVDTSHVIIDPAGTTTLSVPLSDTATGSRSFLFSFSTCRAMEEGELDAGYIASAKFLHLENAGSVSAAAAKIARKNGIKVVIDADNEHSVKLEDLHLIDVVIASEFFYRAHFQFNRYEDACRSILSMGPEIIVFTLGGQGCVGMDEEGYFEVPAFKVDVADTTGAGDVFHGAFIYGLLQGRKARECSVFASAVAAVKCTRLGGRAGIPNLETTLKFLQGGEIDYAEIDRRVAFYKNPPAWPE